MYKIPTNPTALPFQQIAMDLIIGLPESNRHDSILTIIDHGCSHATVFLPCTKEISSPKIAQLYFDYIYRWFGHPKKIISDQDPCFTSHFGKALTAKLGIMQNLSTVFHPQTDGLSEQKNQWIEQYLRLLTTTQQDDWDEWLTIASAVHNDRVNSTLGMTVTAKIRVLLRRAATRFEGRYKSFRGKGGEGDAAHSEAQRGKKSQKNRLRQGRQIVRVRQKK